MAPRTFTYHGFPSYILLPLQLFHGWVLPVPSRRTPGSSGLAEWPLAAMAYLAWIALVCQVPVTVGNSQMAPVYAGPD